MKKSDFHRKIRKSHRYLGVALGIQFLFWTISGLYFSWSNMDDVHGDPQKRAVPLFKVNQVWVSPSIIIDSLRAHAPVDSIIGLESIELFGKPFYQIHYTVSNVHLHSGSYVCLANAETGKLRPALSQAEAVELAQNRFVGDPKVEKVEFLTQTNGHHEYRNLPLPAYAVTFGKPVSTTVYIAAELGTVQKYRNTKWRIFDFLWMLHLMDYESRDNLSNGLLRAFSLFGLLTVASGFTLFWVSRKTTVQKKNLKMS